MMEEGYFLSLEAILSAEIINVIILMYLLLFSTYCYAYLFHHDKLSRLLSFTSKAIPDDDSIELSRGSVSFDNSSFDSENVLPLTDRYHFRVSLLNACLLQFINNI